jgi:hypothetical protein
MGLAYRLGHWCPLSLMLESSHTLASSAAVLWRGAEAAGGADAMIEVGIAPGKKPGETVVSQRTRGADGLWKVCVTAGFGGARGGGDDASAYVCAKRT